MPDRATKPVAKNRSSTFELCPSGTGRPGSLLTGASSNRSCGPCLRAPEVVVKVSRARRARPVPSPTFATSIATASSRSRPTTGDTSRGKASRRTSSTTGISTQRSAGPRAVPRQGRVASPRGSFTTSFSRCRRGPRPRSCCSRAGTSHGSSSPSSIAMPWPCTRTRTIRTCTWSSRRALHTVSCGDDLAGTVLERCRR